MESNLSGFEIPSPPWNKLHNFSTISLLITYSDNQDASSVRDHLVIHDTPNWAVVILVFQYLTWIPLGLPEHWIASTGLYPYNFTGILLVKEVFYYGPEFSWFYYFWAFLPMSFDIPMVLWSTSTSSYTPKLTYILSYLLWDYPR